MKYSNPITTTKIFSNFMAVSQYILDGQQLRVISGENFCGQANNDDAFELCLSGSKDISDQLAGLTIDSSDAGTAVIQSCTAQTDASCSGLLYQCFLTTQTFEIPQCIKSISNGDETVTCPSNVCTPNI